MGSYIKGFFRICRRNKYGSSYFKVKYVGTQLENLWICTKQQRLSRFTENFLALAYIDALVFV